MKRIILGILLLCALVINAQEQLSKGLLKQRQLFPQEKVYIMTDRDLYTGGDTIWMRPWIYDCNTAKPISRSKYLYVELRDAADNLKRRVKIINRDGKMEGFLPLPSDLMSGDYTLCAYTYYMTGTTDELYFKKRLHIMKPADVKAGLYPANLQTPRSVETFETLETWKSTVPTGAHVALSVTNDRLCLADSTSSIVWSLRHQPDLFTNENVKAAGVLYSPVVPYELGQVISGTVYGNISTKKPQPKIKVSIMVPSRNIFDVKTTGTDGHFEFMGFNLPDSTVVYLAGKKGKRTTMDNITMDNDSLPELIHPLPAVPYYYKRTKKVDSDFLIVNNTIDLANTQLLDEVVVEGRKKEKPGDEYDNTAEKTMRDKDFEAMGCYDVRSALSRIPGLMEKTGVFYFRGQPCSVYIDGILDTDNSHGRSEDNGDIETVAQESPAFNYPTEIIERIDLLRPENAAFLTGGGGQGVPAICITMKEGADISKYNDSAVKVLRPLGYEKHIDFTMRDASTPWPVLYWNPDVTVVDDTTIYSIIQKVLTPDRFKDDTLHYTLHIDGFTTDGKPVHEQITFTK